MRSSPNGSLLITGITLHGCTIDWRNAMQFRWGMQVRWWASHVHCDWGAGFRGESHWRVSWGGVWKRRKRRFLVFLFLVNKNMIGALYTNWRCDICIKSATNEIFFTGNFLVHGIHPDGTSSHQTPPTYGNLYVFQSEPRKFRWSKEATEATWFFFFILGGGQCNGQL